MMKAIIAIILFVSSFHVSAESKRVEVYEKGQQYRDVSSGDSLSQICYGLGVTTSSKRVACQQQILENNPDAFVNRDPNRLIVGKRLWLPGSYRPVSKLDKRKYDIKNFSWGSVKTPK